MLIGAGTVCITTEVASTDTAVNMRGWEDTSQAGMQSGNPVLSSASGCQRACHTAGFADNRVPRSGYGEKCVYDALHDLGVRTVVIPRKAPSRARRTAEHLARVPRNNQVAHRGVEAASAPSNANTAGTEPPRHRRRWDQHGSLGPHPRRDRCPYPIRRRPPAT